MAEWLDARGVHRLPTTRKQGLQVIFSHATWFEACRWEGPLSVLGVRLTSLATSPQATST